MNPGDCIGEMAILDNAPRSASVLATEETEVIVITNETMMNGLRKLPDWLAKIMNNMTERLRTASDNVHPLNRTDPSYHILNQLKLLYPYSGVLSEDDEGHTIYILDSEKVINDIALQLCLPEPQVKTVIKRLMDTNLVRIIDETHFELPNFNLYIKYVDFTAEKLNISGHSNESSDCRLFTNESELVISFNQADQPESTAISPYPIEAAEDLLDCDSSEIIAKFNNYLRFIQTGTR